MKDLLNGWGPSVAVFLPLVGIAVMMAIPRSEETLHKVVALATSLIVFAVGVGFLVEFDYGQSAQMQFFSDKIWIELINSRYIVGIDGISLPLIALTVFVVPLVIIYSWDHFPEPHNPKAFLMLILILETGMIGTFVAQDLLLFFVFFELVLLPMYFMIGVFGVRATQVRLHQVLPLHRLRLGADDRVHPGHLLPLAGGQRRRPDDALLLHDRAGQLGVARGW